MTHFFPSKHVQPLLICTDVLFIKLANRQTLSFLSSAGGKRHREVTYMLSLSIIPYVLNADGMRVRANTASVALNGGGVLRPRDWQHSGRLGCMVDIYVYNVSCGGGQFLLFEQELVFLSVSAAPVHSLNRHRLRERGARGHRGGTGGQNVHGGGLHDC